MFIMGESLVVERFFCTTEFPYKYGGPVFHFFDENFEEFTSLEAARDFALSLEVVSDGDDAVQVSWGVMNKKSLYTSQ